MKPESHLQAFDEHKSAIFEWAIPVRGLKKSQRTIGLHASRAIIELLSAYLHEKSIIDVGSQLNHRWFKSEKVKGRFPDFKDKTLLVPKLIELEKLCEELAYSSEKPEEKMIKAIDLFKELEEKIMEMRK